MRTSRDEIERARSVERALASLVADAIRRVAFTPGRVEHGFTARLDTQVLARLARPVAPAELDRLRAIAAPFTRVAKGLDRWRDFAGWASAARVAHALALAWDELRYELEVGEHPPEPACDCALVARLPTQRRRPRSDRLRCIDTDTSDSVLTRRTLVCERCGACWEACDSDYPGDPIGGTTWAPLPSDARK